VAGVVLFAVLAIVVCGNGLPWSSTSMPVSAGGDGAQEVWFLAWPAYALSHGLNPFFTSYAAYPRGIDLLSSTSMPLLGIVMAPITLTAGPVAAFNLLVRLALLASATSMFLVLRRYVTWWPFALAGGLLYGFSPYMLNEGFTHLFLVFVPIPPLLFMLVEDLLITRKWRPVKVGVLIGVLAAAQFLISSETLAISVLAIVAALVLLVIRHPIAAREAVPRLLPGVGAAAVSFLVVAGYGIYCYLAGPEHVSGPQHPKLTYVLFHDDLAGSVLPTTYQLLGPHSWMNRGDFLLQGNGVDHVTYLGIPLVVLAAYIAVRCRRNGIVAISSLLALGSLVLTLGPHLFVDGYEHLSSLRLPYDILLHLPLLDGLLATRFILAEYFFVAVILAVGLDQMRSEGLIGLRSSNQPAATERSLAIRAATCAGLAVVALLPMLPAHTYNAVPVPVPPFFYNSALLDQIPAGSTVLPYPSPQLPSVLSGAAPDTRAMLWQAVTDMRFKMIGAYAAQPYHGSLGQGNELLNDPIDVQQFFGWAQFGSKVVAPVPISAATLADLREFCVRYNVSTILVDPTVGLYPSKLVQYVTLGLRAAPRHVGGLDVWFGASTLAGRGSN
jgi:hypothetical protein